MSPIIDIQRRMVEVGRIRAGDRHSGHPRKLDKWRLTSKDRTRLEAAAVLWGGAVKEWEGRDGEFELYTETNELPIMLLPETEPSLYLRDVDEGRLPASVRRAAGTALRPALPMRGGARVQAAPAHPRAAPRPQGHRLLAREQRRAAQAGRQRVHASLLAVPDVVRADGDD